MVNDRITFGGESRTQTPHVDDEQDCDGCGKGGRTVIVGELLLFDWGQRDPDSMSCSLCAECLKAALRLLEPEALR